MSPEHAAAHLVAKHLRAIALLLPRLSAEGRQVFLPNWEATTVPVDAVVAMQTNKAVALEATAPFEPVTDEQRGEIFESYVDCMGDLSSRERAEIVVDEWTEAEWRMEQDDQEEMDRESDDYVPESRVEPLLDRG